MVGALERLRATFRWKVSGLDSSGLQARIGASSLTLGGLIKHLARAEAQRFGPMLDGSSIGSPWESVDWDSDPDWDFNSAAEDTPEQLYALWDGTVARSRAKLETVLATDTLDKTTCLEGADGSRASLRRSVCDMIEEYGRHTGHADLIRESIDGLTGEDPPADWRPA